MPRQLILTDKERDDFLALPTDDDTLIRYWTLDEADHRLLLSRRRPDTRLGLALQLCGLRYPGRLIQRGEMIPSNALSFLADQLKLDAEVLVNFARRIATRYDQIAMLRHVYGFVDLTVPIRDELLVWARGVAIAAPKDKHVIRALADQMRRRRVIIPGLTVLERLAAKACTEAEEIIHES
ncbi:DUF4158 domain-containing protein [Phyllobacterium sp. OV277]|jgi:hypothetical protein|uniref:DUF4158 domain-containing protein n=1 Tax=Phyllobacterium sp. OV277 TaxID=1882772 RepID=UPI00089011CF|nr:DUF4158 domain-containing protein [Phyllobacterium sp. OV277]SDP37265.1 protein of unknown function [Phyllobacterium sp. OV277]